MWLPRGNEEERARADLIAEAAGNVQVLSRLAWLGLVSMLMEVDGAVAVDNGLAHLRAALDAPTDSLYVPTNIQLISAYGRNQIHMQPPIGQPDISDSLIMMRSIEAAKVREEVYNLLAASK